MRATGLGQVAVEYTQQQLLPNKKIKQPIIPKQGLILGFGSTFTSVGLATAGFVDHATQRITLLPVLVTLNAFFVYQRAPLSKLQIFHLGTRSVRAREEFRLGTPPSFVSI